MGDITRRMQERQVEVSRTDLLARLRTNREQHLKDYEEALAEYPEAFTLAVHDFRRTLNAFDAGAAVEKGAQGAVMRFQRKVMHTWNPPAHPTSYVDQYDRMIELMEVEVRDTIELSGREVACLMFDKWDWKEAFNAAVQSIKSYTQS